MLIEGDKWSDREFRRGAWHRTATTVAMLTVAADGRTNVMACEWAMIVSNSPLRFVISVGPHHVSHTMIEQAGEFGLNFCSDQQAALSHVAGSFSMRDTDKWALAQFPTYAAHSIGAPMIEGCVLNAECRVISTQPLGDHTVFIGEALWARYDPELEPLLYHGGKYYFVGAQIPKE